MVKVNTKVGISFGDGLKYPLNKFARIFNFYWILIPIVGVFALLGYALNIMKEIVGGKVDELPAFGSFGDNLKEGFFAFIYYLPLLIGVMILSMIPLLGWLVQVIYSLIIPMLFINYAMKRNFASLYDFKWVFNAVFNDFGTYLIAFLKTMALGLIWLVASIPIVTMIVTIPAWSLGSNIFLAEYYRNH